MLALVFFAILQELTRSLLAAPKTHMCIYLIPTQLFWAFKSRNGRHVFLSQVVPEPRKR